MMPPLGHTIVFAVWAWQAAQAIEQWPRMSTSERNFAVRFLAVIGVAMLTWIEVMS